VEVLAKLTLQGGKEAGFYLYPFSILAQCAVAQTEMHHKKTVATGAGASEARAYQTLA